MRIQKRNLKEILKIWYCYILEFLVDVHSEALRLNIDFKSEAKIQRSCSVIHEDQSLIFGGVGTFSNQVRSMFNLQEL